MNSRQKLKHDCNSHTTFFQRSFLHRQSDGAALSCSELTLVSLRRAAGFQDGPDHSHEGSRLVPAEPRRLLCPRRPVETGVGEGRPGSCQPPVHPTARHQVGQIKKDRRRVSSDPLLSLTGNPGEANLKACFLRETLFWFKLLIRLLPFNFIHQRELLSGISGCVFVRWQVLLKSSRLEDRLLWGECSSRTRKSNLGHICSVNSLSCCGTEYLLGVIKPWNVALFSPSVL